MSLGLFLPALHATAGAMPYFSYQYGYACSQCHSTVPQLTPFGKAFRFAGYRLPGVRAAPGVIPLATQNAILHTSAPDAGLPKTIDDYLEMNSAGPIGKAFDYFARTYAIDGGKPGSLQDLWIEYSSGTANPDAARDLRLKVGKFYLPLPVSAETYRETINHYAAFDQTVGSNPFNLFDSRLGFDASVGAQYVGSSLHVVVTQGHDSGSGLRSARPDVMLYGEHSGSALTFSGYAVQGERDIDASTLDVFDRLGAGATLRRGKADITALLQRGSDSSGDARGQAERSGAGFAQLRWGFSQALTAVLREDGTNDNASILRETTGSLIIRTRANSKLVIEGVLGPVSTLNIEFFVSN